MTLLLILGAAIQPPTIAAQHLVLSHANKIGGGDNTFAYGAAVDDGGNLFTAGFFRGTADFDPGPGEYNLTSVAGRDIFICKLNASGGFEWARSMGDSFYDEAYGTVVDASGNSYTTGGFRGTVDFDPGSEVFTLTSGTGGNDTFIVKLDTNGTFQWARSVGGDPNDKGTAIALDGLGNIVFTGGFAGLADFDPGPGTFILDSDSDGGKVYVCSLNSSGDFLWAGAMGGFAGKSMDIAADASGNVYTVGLFRGSEDFDPGPASYVVSSAGDDDVFVQKLDASGSFQWAGAIGGTGRDKGFGVVVDETGSVYCTGEIGAEADFDPGPGTANLPASSGQNSFVCKLGSLGGFIWARVTGASGLNLGQEIVLDDTGNVFVVGDFRDTVDFDPGPETLGLSAAGEYDVYVWKLSTLGELLWAGGMGGPDGDYVREVTIDDTGNIYCVGEFLTAADFDPSSNTYTLSSVGHWSAFSAKLESQSLPVAGDDRGETDADRLLSSIVFPNSNSLLANDTDANTRYTLTVTAHEVTSALGATVLVNPDGTFVYDPTAVAAFQALAPGESLVDTFTYTLSDGTDTDIGTVTVTVFGKGSSLPAIKLWGLGLLLLTLAGVGIRARRRPLRETTCQGL